jgi:hypothetical protein
MPPRRPPLRTVAPAAAPRARHPRLAHATLPINPALTLTLTPHPK